MSTYDDASLIMFPSGYKEDKIYSLKPTDGSGDLTFTRASSATRVNAEGLIEEASILGSELIVNGDFASGSGWSLVGDFAISGGKASITSASQYSQLTSQGTNFLTSGKQYKLQVDVETLSISGSFAYRFTGGAVTPILTSQIVDGKFEATFTMPSNGYLWFQTTGSYTGLNVTIDNVSVKEVITLNVPRIDYTGGGCGKLLLEPQRTNLVTYSEQFDNAAWLKSNSTITANATTSPDGTTNADKLIPSATPSVNKYIYRSVSAASGSVYSITIFAKAAEYDRLRIEDGNNSQGAWFNLSSGTVGTVGASTTANIEALDNGWYRCSISKATVTTSIFFVIVGSNAENIQVGDGTSGIYIYGAGAELGSYATSYIPTTTTAVTRLADSASKTGISSLIGQTEGTIFLEADIQKYNESSIYVAISAGAVLGTSIYIIQQTSGSLNVLVRNSGNPDASIAINSANWTAGFNKVAIAYTATTAEVFINGVTKGTTSFVSAPACSQLTIGSRPDGVGTLVGTGGYSQALLFTTRLTNAELATLTTL